MMERAAQCLTKGVVSMNDGRSAFLAMAGGSTARSEAAAATVSEVYVSENPVLATIRAGQAERLRQAKEYRETVGDPLEKLSTLLPIPVEDVFALSASVDSLACNRLPARSRRSQWIRRGPAAPPLLRTGRGGRG